MKSHSLPPDLPLPPFFIHRGLQFFFYSHEHTPVHVHIRHEGCESKATFYYENGKLIKIKVSPVKGKKPLVGEVLSIAQHFVNQYAEEITQQWVDYFIYHRFLRTKELL
jgi:hypothetical protein